MRLRLQLRASGLSTCRHGGQGGEERPGPSLVVVGTRLCGIGNAVSWWLVRRVEAGEGGNECWAHVRMVCGEEKGMLAVM